MNKKAMPKALKKQIQFATDIKTPVLGLVAGYGYGKSDATAMRAINLRRIEKKLGSKGNICIIAHSYVILRDACIPKTKRYFDQCRIKYQWKEIDKKMIVTSPAFEGEIFFRSADKPENIVAFDAPHIIIDEFDVPKYDKQALTYEKAVGRQRGSSFTTLAISTTAEGHKYTYDLLDPSGKYYRPDSKLINARSYENSFVSEKYLWNMFITYGKNAPMEKPKDKSWSDCYVDYYTKLLGQYVGGEFHNLNGLSAYYGFSEANIIKTESVLNPPMVYIGMDFNVNPMTAVCAIKEVDPVRNVNVFKVFKEYYLKNSNTASMAELIRRDFPNSFIHIFPDATGNQRKTSAIGRTDISILERDFGFKVERRKRNPYIRDRLNCVNHELINVNVKIMDCCKHLLEDMAKVVLDDYGRLDKTLEKQGLVHISDAFGYLLYLNSAFTQYR